MTILHLDSSPRAASHSRALSAEAVLSLQARFPRAPVVFNAQGPAKFAVISENWVGGAYIAPDARTSEQVEALQLSDELTAQFLEADVIVAGVPMYNFSIPAVFKAWLDQVSRFGLTFSSGPNGAVGLVGDKPVLFVTARGGGGYGPGENRESMNFEDPYLKNLFAFFGIHNTHFAHINNTINDSLRADAVEQVRTQIQKFTASVEVSS